jgi:NADH:ubiquinone oxidoreductase subunit
MGLFSLFSPVSPVHVWWLTLISGAKKIGKDSLGNVYFEAKARKGYNHPRRWVLYKGLPEATKVPPEWHGWLHYQTDAVPGPQSFRRGWQQAPVSNRTGTGEAYHPQKSKENHIRTTGDYEAWSPPGA